MKSMRRASFIRTKLFILLCFVSSWVVFSADRVAPVSGFSRTRLTEFGDVEVFKLRLPPGEMTNKTIRITAIGGSAAKSEWLTPGKNDAAAECSLMLLDLRQAANDNSAASIRVGVKCADTTVYEKFTFPKGIAMFEEHIINPQEFHFRWKLGQGYSPPDNPANALTIEVQLVERTREEMDKEAANRSAKDQALRKMMIERALQERKKAKPQEKQVPNPK